MHRLLDSVTSLIQRERLLAPGDRLLVAVSGGCDSVVLLHVLQRLAASTGWQLEVAHFNHQLRGAEADADEQWVRRLADRWQLACHCDRQNVRAWAATHRISLEMAARHLRHAFLAATAAHRRCPAVALGHHADDRIETLFLRLLRGSANLAGLRPVSPSPANPGIQLIRPLLESSRNEIRDYAREHGLEWREDPSNQTDSILRNRIRHRLLPFLTAEFAPHRPPPFERVLSVIGAETDFLAQTAARWVAGESATSFACLHPAVQRHVILHQLHLLALPPSFDVVESLRLHPGQPFQVDSTRRVRRDDTGRLHVDQPAPTSFNPVRQTVSIEEPAGQTTFSGLRLAWELSPCVTHPDPTRPLPGELYLDPEPIGSPVVLRHWQPGDRFQPIGLPRPAKLQDLFINAKIPRFERHRRVLAVALSGRIFWVEGLRPAEFAKIRPTTRRLLHWTWRRFEPAPSPAAP